MEGRMTVCNMTIEAGGRAVTAAPADTPFEWLEGRPAAPDPLPTDEWCALRTEDGASFDREVEIDAGEVAPQVTWGTPPEVVARVSGAVREPSSEGEGCVLKYMDLRAGTAIQDIKLDSATI